MRASECVLVTCREKKNVTKRKLFFCQQDSFMRAVLFTED